MFRCVTYRVLTELSILIRIDLIVVTIYRYNQLEGNKT